MSTRILDRVRLEGVATHWQIIQILLVFCLFQKRRVYPQPLPLISANRMSICTYCPRVPDLISNAARVYVHSFLVDSIPKPSDSDLEI